jgi:hypothetical protein
MPPKKVRQYDLIVTAIDAVKLHPKFHDRVTETWLTDISLVRAIAESGYLSQHTDLNLDAGKLNKALTSHPTVSIAMKNFEGNKTSGIYRVQYNNRFFYYLTSKTNKHLQYPPVLQKEWLPKVLNSQVAIFRPSRKVEAVTSTPAPTTKPVG